jgi:hypothetical protein
MIRAMVIATLVLAALPAGAGTPGPGEATLAPDGQATIASPPCTAPSLGPDYVPGVDVDGNAVASADLPQAPAATPADAATIEPDARRAARFGAARPAGTDATQARIGTITARDGHAFRNGQPLAPDANAATLATCGAAEPQK